MPESSKQSSPQTHLAALAGYHNEFATMAFADFLEALCRVSIVKTWPSDAVLNLPMADALDFFDNVEALNTDPKKALYLDKPAPYTSTWSHNVASRIKKLLLTLYRRLAAALPSNDSLQARCLRPGMARAVAQLNLRSDGGMPPAAV